MGNKPATEEINTPSFELLQRTLDAATAFVEKFDDINGISTDITTVGSKAKEFANYHKELENALKKRTQKYGSNGEKILAILDDINSCLTITTTTYTESLISLLVSKTKGSLPLRLYFIGIEADTFNLLLQTKKDISNRIEDVKQILPTITKLAKDLPGLDPFVTDIEDLLTSLTSHYHTLEVVLFQLNVEPYVFEPIYFKPIILTVTKLESKFAGLYASIQSYIDNIPKFKNNLEKATNLLRDKVAKNIVTYVKDQRKKKKSLAQEQDEAVEDDYEEEEEEDVQFESELNFFGVDKDEVNNLIQNKNAVKLQEATSLLKQPNYSVGLIQVEGCDIDISALPELQVNFDLQTLETLKAQNISTQLKQLKQTYVISADHLKEVKSLGGRKGEFIYRIKDEFESLMKTKEEHMSLYFNTTFSIWLVLGICMSSIMTFYPSSPLDVAGADALNSEQKAAIVWAFSVTGFFQSWVMLVVSLASFNIITELIDTLKGTPKSIVIQNHEVKEEFVRRRKIMFGIAGFGLACYLALTITVSVLYAVFLVDNSYFNFSMLAFACQGVGIVILVVTAATWKKGRDYFVHSFNRAK